MIIIIIRFEKKNKVLVYNQLAAAAKLSTLKINRQHILDPPMSLSHNDQMANL